TRREPAKRGPTLLRYVSGRHERYVHTHGDGQLRLYRERVSSDRHGYDCDHMRRYRSRLLAESDMGRPTATSGHPVPDCARHIQCSVRVPDWRGVVYRPLAPHV